MEGYFGSQRPYGDAPSYKSYRGHGGLDGEELDPVKFEKQAKSFLFFFYAIILASLVLATLFGAVLTFIGPQIQNYLQVSLSFVSAKLLSTSIAVLGALGVPTLGYLLYRLRKIARSLYGALEVVFGVFLSYFTIHKTVGDAVTLNTLSSTHMIVTFTALLSSVYIAVRGLDNMTQGREKAKGIKRMVDAIESGDEELVRWLLNSGVSLHSLTRSGDSLLMVAVRHGRTGLVDYFLTRGANVYVTNKKGESLNSLVTETQNQEIRALLRRVDSGIFSSR